MKRALFQNALVCALFLAGITGCGQKQDAGAPHVDPSQSPIADPASPLYGWEKFSSAEGKFSAIFPTRPIEEITTLPGQTVGVHVFASQDSNNGYLVAYYNRQQADDPKSALAKMEEGMLKKFDGRVVSHQEMEVDNCPAMESEVALDDQHSSKMRAIFVGQRVYELTVFYLTAQPHRDACEAFFNSFSLQSQIIP